MTNDCVSGSNPNDTNELQQAQQGISSVKSIVSFLKEIILPENRFSFFHKTQKFWQIFLNLIY